MKRRSFALAMLALSAAPLVGCGKKPFYAQSAVLGDLVHVRVNRAYARGDRLFVKTYMTNASDVPIRIARDGFSLALPNGRVLPRSVGVTTRHNVYTLKPGEGRDVWVDFHEDDTAFAELSGASLIVGGIFIDKDPHAHVIGEVPLSPTYTAVHAGLPREPKPQGAPPKAPKKEPEAKPQTEIVVGSAKR